MLADGRIDPNADNSDYVEPDFANSECWKPTLDGVGISDPSLSVYAGDGIWYFLVRTSSGNSGDVYKYNINAGSIDCIISNVYQYNATAYIVNIHFNRAAKSIVLEEVGAADSFSIDVVYFDTDGNFIKKITCPSSSGLTSPTYWLIASHNGVAYNAITYYNSDVSYSWWINIYADSTLLLSFNTWMGEAKIYHKIIPLYFNNALYMAFISPVAHCSQTNTSINWWNGQYNHLYKVEGSELVSIATMTMDSYLDTVRTS